MSKDIYIGLISGTSADGIDAVAVSLTENSMELLAQNTFEYPEKIREEVLLLSQPAVHNGEQRIDRMGHLDHALGDLFAEAALKIAQQAGLEMSQVKAIGSHGQTIRHRPQGKNRFSLQIADPNTIAYKTGALTVADFRRMDVAAGGQGAPLVPLFHQWLFGEKSINRVILNLGGIANLTWLPKDNGQVVGFDTGPANALIDLWIKKHQGHSHDENGDWAAGGFVHNELLKHMFADPFFMMPAPKSTGREYFDEQWIEQKLKGADPASPQDVQATLVELTAKTIVSQIHKLPDVCDELLICGGGAHNEFLVSRIKHHLSKHTQVLPLEQSNIDTDYIEAATFAWLAKQRVDEHRLDYRTVTGSNKPVLLGNLFKA